MRKNKERSHPSVGNKHSKDVVLNKQRNCIQADGDRKINCVTRLVCRTWFWYYVAEMAALILNLRQADPYRLVDGRGD